MSITVLPNTPCAFSSLLKYNFWNLSNQAGLNPSALDNSPLTLRSGAAKSPNIILFAKLSSGKFWKKYAAGIRIVGPTPGKTVAAMLRLCAYTGMLTFTLRLFSVSPNIQSCTNPCPG